MTEMRAKLTLDASSYRDQINQIGRETEQSLAKAGQSSSAAGKQIGGVADQVQSVGRHAKTTGEQMEAAFGHMRWTHLVGAMALIHTASGMLAGALQTARAESDLASAALEGNAVGILQAQQAVGEAHARMREAIPVIGAAINRAFAGEEGTERAIKNIERIQEAASKAAEENLRQQRENALETATLAGASESEQMRIRAKFADEDRKNRIAALEAEVDNAAATLEKQRASFGAAIGTPGIGVGEAMGMRSYGLREDLDASAALIADYYARWKALDEQLSTARSNAATKARNETEAVAQAEKKEQDARQKGLDDWLSAVESTDDQIEAEWAKLAEESRKTEEDLTKDLIRQYETQYEAWKRLLDKRVVEGQRLQDQLRDLERGESRSKESYYERTLEMDLRATQDPEKRRQLNLGAAGRFYQAAVASYGGGKGDMEETRRLLDKSMGYAERGGDRAAMDRLQGDILQTFEAQKKATQEAVAESKRAQDEVIAEMDKLSKAAAVAEAALAALGSTAEGVGPLWGGFASGGLVSGPGSGDSVPAWLTPGEFVVNAGVASRNGRFLAALNAGEVTLPASAARFASGGPVGGPGAGFGGTLNATIQVTAAPGMNERDLARRVVDELARLRERGRA